MPNIPRQRGSDAYKAIPDPVVGDDSLYHAVVALKEVVEVLTRQRKPMLASAVTFQDLVDYGLIGSDARALLDYGKLGNDLNTAWTAYTPTISAATGSFTSASASGRYKQIGKTVFLFGQVNITTNGTAAGYVAFTLPVPAQGYAIMHGREGAVNGHSLSVIGSTTAVVIVKYDNSYPGGNGTALQFGGVYEAA